MKISATTMCTVQVYGVVRKIETFENGDEDAEGEETIVVGVCI